MSTLASGTQSTTISAKHQLYTTTNNGVYVLMVDASALANGDRLEILIDVGFASGDAHVQTHYAVFANIQDDPGKVSVPVVAPFGATFYLRQAAGTSRSFKWCIAAA